jgi:hypothetical protein
MLRLCTLITSVAFLFPITTSFAAELSTLSGKKYSGDLVAINERTVTLKTSEGDVETQLADILTLNLKDGAAKLPPKFTDVELVDGTIFHCVKVELKGKKANIELPSGAKITVDLTAISYVLNEAQVEAIRKEFGAIISDRTKSDRFFVHKGGRLDGLEGTFGDASDDGANIAFTDKSGDKRALPLDRLAALLFNNRLEGNIPPTACRVTDANQNVIVAQKAVLKDKSLSLLTVGGVVVEFPTLEPVMSLDYSKDKIVYLSDMKPVAEEKSFDDLAVIFTRDSNLDNQPIQLEGVPYGKGMVLHAPLTMSFDLAAQYKEFKTVVGVDTAVQTPSDVRLIFEGDGRKLFEIEVKVKDAPKPITLDVKKVRQFTVRVAQVEGLPFGHQVALADAKVTK